MARVAVDDRLEAVRGALVRLGEAEQLVRGVTGSASAWALREQLVQYDTNLIGGPYSHEFLRSRAFILILPAWGWLLAGAFVLAVPLFLVWFKAWLFGAGIGALLGLYGRYALTLKLSEQLRRPSEEDFEAACRALGEASRLARAAGVPWTGGEPSPADTPWKLRSQIEAKREALRDAEVQALVGR